MFIGGAGLDSATPQALYCAAYRNGTFIIRGFSGGKRFDVVAKPTPNAAVKTAASADAEVVQDVSWNVRGDKLECVVNGTAVWSGTKADVTGDGKLAVDGRRCRHSRQPQLRRDGHGFRGRQVREETGGCERRSYPVRSSHR